MLWLGQEAAVFRERERTNLLPEWSEPRESGDWTLECRDWRKVPNNELTGGALAPSSDQRERG